MPHMLRKLALPAFMLFALPASAEMMVSNARIGLGIGDRPGVLHGTIMNHGDGDTALIGADSPAFQRIELHTHDKNADGMMRMRQVEAYDLPQHGSVKLAPHGDHLMLFGFSGQAGDMVKVTLRFADGQSKTIEVKTQARQKRGHTHGGGKNLPKAKHSGH